MQAEHWLHRFVLHKFFIVPYIAMHKTLECTEVANFYQEARFDEFTSICHAH